MISLKGLDKADVLSALFAVAKPQGNGHLLYNPNTTLTREQANQMLERTMVFDYIEGRSCKVDLTDDEFEPWLFDRDNGEGAAARAINELRERQQVHPAAAE